MINKQAAVSRGRSILTVSCSFQLPFADRPIPNAHYPSRQSSNPQNPNHSASHPNPMKYLLTLILLFNLTTLLAQSTSVAAFHEQHATSQDFYLYPSTLRMVNLEKNPDAYTLVNEVEKLQILLFDRQSVDRPALQKLQQGIRDEAYEELISFRQKDSQITVYARGDSPQLDGVVGVVDNKQTLALIDLAGFIDLPSLMNLAQSDYDFSAVTQLVNMTVAEHKENEQHDQDED